MTGNDICERVVKHWEKHHAILPEIISMESRFIEEIVDGIRDEHSDIIRALRMIC